MAISRRALISPGLMLCRVAAIGGCADSAPVLRMPNPALSLASTSSLPEILSCSGIWESSMWSTA